LTNSNYSNLIGTFLDGTYYYFYLVYGYSFFLSD
jgi:hypothetical protein